MAKRTSKYRAQKWKSVAIVPQVKAIQCFDESAVSDCEGIIEDVIMLGTPVTANPEEWKKLQRVVSGNIVNGYCRCVICKTTSPAFSS